MSESANVVALQTAAFLPISKVRIISGFSKSTILRKIAAGEFPAPVIQEGNVTRWDAAEIQVWRAEQFRKREERLRSAQPQAAASA